MSIAIAGLLRLQQIYQGLKPGNESFQVELVKRISNVSMAIEFLHTLEHIGRFTNKHIVLDCPTEMAKQILIQHVRDLRLGRRTYHYLLSGLVSRIVIAAIARASGFWLLALTMAMAVAVAVAMLAEFSTIVHRFRLAGHGRSLGKRDNRIWCH